MWPVYTRLCTCVYVCYLVCKCICFPLSRAVDLACTPQAEVEQLHFTEEIEINEFPQNARWKVTHKVMCGHQSVHLGLVYTQPISLAVRTLWLRSKSTAEQPSQCEGSTFSLASSPKRASVNFISWSRLIQSARYGIKEGGVRAYAVFCNVKLVRSLADPDGAV